MKEFRNGYTVIACVNGNGKIGNEGKLLYHIKADMENFKSMTTGGVVIMGRKTFESLPGNKPLKDRVNIVLTSRADYFAGSVDDEAFKDTYVCFGLREADALCYSMFPDRDLFIVGGGEVYRQAFDADIVDKAVITLVNDDSDGDADFPDLSDDVRYKEIFRTTSLRDHPSDLYYRYIVYKRKRNVQQG